MESSNFVNVTGLDIDNHYSTVSDLLKMLQYALKMKHLKQSIQLKVILYQMV